MTSNEIQNQELFTKGVNIIDETYLLYEKDPKNPKLYEGYNLGLNFINDASNNGHLESHMYLGNYFNYNGNNRELAFEYYNRAANLGDPKGRYMVSIFLNKGLAGIKDLKKAFNIMNALADENYHFAQLDLALFYLNGEGCEKDLNKSFKYFELSANQGNSIAQNDLGVCYLNGEGTEKNYAKAFYWFNESGKNNNADGYYNLGCMFINGLVVKENLEYGFDCLVLSARIGHSMASDFLRKENIDISIYKQNLIKDYSFIISLKNVNDQKKPSFKILSPYFTCEPDTFILKNVDEIYEGQTPLFMCLNSPNCILNIEQWDYLIKESNLKFYSQNKVSLFTSAVMTDNKSFILTKEYLDILIKNCDLKFVDNEGYSNLLDLLLSPNNITIEIEQLEYMIRNSDLILITNRGQDVLTTILTTFESKKVYHKIDNNLWFYIFKNSNLLKITELNGTKHSVLDLINKISNSAWKEYFHKVYNSITNVEVEKPLITIHNSLVEEYKEKIKKVVGLKEIKESFNTLINLYNFNKNNNLQTNAHMKMIFVGNHGTGKSLISKYIANLYKALEILPDENCYTVFNNFFFLQGKDLNFYNKKTVYCKFDSKIKYEANNELLMIDALKKLEDSTLFILSTTPEELEDIKVKYPKFYSLFTKVINFPDYNSEELSFITKDLLETKGFITSDEVFNKIKLYYDYCKKNKSLLFSNAYLCKNTLNQIMESHVNNSNKNDLMLSINDIPNIEVNFENNSIEELLKELNELTGLDSIKNTLLDYIALVQANKRRGTEINTNMHLVFTGNPGTGKTTVARLIGKIYKALGLLPEGHVVETDRSDLVAGYIGHTALKTKEVIKKAMGGILFIDEAYTLSNSAGSSNDFGKESIDTLLKLMEDHRKDFAVIVAGYNEEMGKFINSNPGLKSRFSKTIVFEDYSLEELIKILINICNKNNFIYDNDFLSEAEVYLSNKKFSKIKTKINNKIGFGKEIEQEKESFNENKSFGNAREVRTLFEKVLEKQAIRIMKDINADPWLLIGSDITNIT